MFLLRNTWQFLNIYVNFTDLVLKEKVAFLKNISLTHVYSNHTQGHVLVLGLKMVGRKVVKSAQREILPRNYGVVAIQKERRASPEF